MCSSSWTWVPSRFHLRPWGTLWPPEQCLDSSFLTPRNIPDLIFFSFLSASQGSLVFFSWQSSPSFFPSIHQSIHPCFLQSLHPSLLVRWEMIQVVDGAETRHCFVLWFFHVVCVSLLAPFLGPGNRNTPVETHNITQQRHEITQRCVIALQSPWHNINDDYGVSGHRLVLTFEKFGYCCAFELCSHNCSFLLFLLLFLKLCM